MPKILQKKNKKKIAINLTSCPVYYIIGNLNGLLYIIVPYGQLEHTAPNKQHTTRWRTVFGLKSSLFCAKSSGTWMTHRTRHKLQEVILDHDVNRWRDFSGSNSNEPDWRILINPYSKPFTTGSECFSMVVMQKKFQLCWSSQNGRDEKDWLGGNQTVGEQMFLPESCCQKSKSLLV